MALKRKRSISTSPLSTASFTSSSSTPEAQSPTPLPHHLDGAMDVDVSAHPFFTTPWHARSRLSSADLGCRTRKRFRDNRPDERSIHETTIQKLFDAQRTHAHAASPVPSGLQPSPRPAPRPAPVQKRTLHAFWDIGLPVPPVHPSALHSLRPQLAPQPSHGPRCDDCDAPLQTESDGVHLHVDDMDWSGAVETNPFACQDCRRNVCATCAVVSNRRHCLGCATRGRKQTPSW